VSDEWQATSRLRLDAGARLQYHAIEGSCANTANARGRQCHILPYLHDQERGRHHKIAATAGGDYEPNTNSGCGQLKRGNVFQQFDTVQSGLVGTQTVDALKAAVWGAAELNGIKARPLRPYLSTQISGIENFDSTRERLDPSSDRCSKPIGYPSSTRPSPFYGLASAPAEHLHARYTTLSTEASIRAATHGRPSRNGKAA